MITGALTTTDHGAVAIIDGTQISCDWEIIEKIAQSYDYREHLTLWTDDAEKAFVRLIGDNIREGTKLAIGTGALKAFHVGKIHVRGIEGYAENLIGDICRDFGFEPDASGRMKSALKFIGEIGRHTRAMGLDKPKGTGAANAHEIWRTAFNPSGRWRCPQDEGAAEEIDFVREALYGGKTVSNLNGCIYTPGNMPAAIVENLGCPAFETPPGFKIWRIDARSAYPSEMRRDLPSPYSGVTEDFNIDCKHGVARVRIRVNSDGPRVVPLRLIGDGGVRTIWPGPGCTVEGVYSYFTLREAEKYGAVIEHVYEARSYAYSTHPLKRFVQRVWDTQKDIDKPTVRKSVKSFGRRLNGRFAVSRWKSELVPLYKYFDLLKIDPTAPMPRMVVGDFCVQRERQEKYPAHSQVLWSISTIDRATIVLSRIEHSLEAAGLRVLYTDTDSVMFIAREGPDGAPDVPGDVKARMGDALGQYRVDWVGDWAVIFGPKFYALDNGKCSFAGIPNDIQSELLHNGVARYEQKETVFSKARTITFRLSAGKIEEA